MTPLSIKVCGMTEAENIREVEQLGVDMIGFIFYPKSPRCLCELPDYLPVLLEFFAQIDAEKARRLLGDAVHVIAHIGNKLEASGSPYAALMKGITAMSRPCAIWTKPWKPSAPMCPAPSPCSSPPWIP